MFTHPTLPLTLTGLEVVYLADSILNGDVALGLPDKEAYVPLARSTLLLLGSAYAELVKVDKIEPGPVTLQFTEEQVWLLRSKVRTGDLGLDGKNVGVGLLLKLYPLLQEFSADVDVPSAGTEGQPLTEDDKKSLQWLAKPPYQGD